MKIWNKCWRAHPVNGRRKFLLQIERIFFIKLWLPQSQSLSNKYLNNLHIEVNMSTHLQLIVFFFCVAGLCVLRSIQTRWQYSPNGAYNIQTYAVNYQIEMCMRCQIFVLLVCFAANFRLIRCESGDVKQQKNIVWITIVSSEGRTIEQAFSS